MVYRPLPKLLADKITTTYRKSKPNNKQMIDLESKSLAKLLNNERKMNCFAKRPAFIALRDHKENIKTKFRCRLIKPTKMRLVRYSSISWRKCTEKLTLNCNLNQWRNTSSGIDRFINIKNGNQCRFIIFDIENFYPSILKQLLKTTQSPSPEMINTITLARKSLLSENNKTE